MTPRGRSRPAMAWAFVFFAAASVAMTWPLATGIRRFVSDPGDPFLAAWILHWDWKQIFHDPRRFFDGNIFYPARLTLAFSENLFGAALFGFPLYFAGWAPLTVYNVLFLLGFALSGFGAWALAREMTGSAAAALVAGIAYAFAPFRFDQLPHFQMQWAGWIPLAILCLWRYLGSGRRRDLVLFTVFFVLNAWTCVYDAIFGGIAAAVTVAARSSDGRSRRSLALPLALAAAGAILAIAPLYRPYAEAARLYRFHRSVAESNAAVLTSFLSAGSRNKLWGAITHRFEKPEAQLFPGLVVVLLAAAAWGRVLRRPKPVPAPARRPPPRALDAGIAALLALRIAVAITGGFRIGPLRIHEPSRLSLLILVAIVARLAVSFPRFSRYADLGDFWRRNRATDVERWAALLVVTCVVVCLGARTFLYREAFEILPFVFGAIRVPARSIVLAHLGLGVLASLAVARWRRPAAFAAAAVLLFELRAAPVSWYDADPTIPPAIAWVDARHPPGGVLELPMKLWDNIAYVFWATGHDFPIVNGYSGFFPKDFETVQAAFLADPVAPDAMSLLRRNGVSAILFHRGRASAAEQKTISRFLAGSIAEGTIVPVRAIGRGAAETLVFADSTFAGVFPSSPADRAAVVDALAHPVPTPVVPVGWYDGPNNGDVFRGSTIRGSGWAACADGLARVAVLLDGKDVGSATLGGYRPDVRRVKPSVPCGDYCGYRFRIDAVPPGLHTVQTRFVGRNGGTAAPPAVEVRVWK